MINIRPTGCWRATGGKCAPRISGFPKPREFPMPDAPHVRAAEAYFRYAPEEKKALLAHRILIKARKYGVHVRSEEILEWASKYSK